MPVIIGDDAGQYPDYHKKEHGIEGFRRCHAGINGAAKIEK
jgi:hypothetical protein